MLAMLHELSVAPLLSRPAASDDKLYQYQCSDVGVSAVLSATSMQRHACLSAFFLAACNCMYEAWKRKGIEFYRGATRNWNLVAVVRLNPEKATNNCKEKQNFEELFESQIRRELACKITLI
jgi:hypothetical protein